MKLGKQLDIEQMMSSSDLDFLNINEEISTSLPFNGL